jgi:class 3 adenylate cyclase
MTDWRPRILVAEDDPDIREILLDTLRLDGSRDLRGVPDGHAALAALQEASFDLVLLDVLMPGLTGLQVLEALRGMPGGMEVPVLVITALDDRETIMRCIRAGAEDRVPKPFDPVILRARVTAALERKRLRDREKAHLAVIEQERRRADELLGAILPGPAVAELKATDRVRPRRFDNVTILFADVVGFTAFCDSHPPEEVVRNVEELVEWFEALAELNGLEKIKTVGDAFLATGNLLLPHADAPLAAVRCALAMADAAAQLPSPWSIRAAVHIGPAVAGVVGRHKLAFDLWGDTVNVAAHLASLGLDPGIYCTTPVWRLLEGRIGGSLLGSMPIKGKGALEVWHCAEMLDLSSSGRA